jgi:hypothetical protein
VSKAILKTLGQSLFTTAKVLGQIDGFSERTLKGWAFSKRNPAQRLRILAECEPGLFAEFRADLYRADVHRAFVDNDGYCGFSIPISRFLWEGPYRILTHPGRRALPGSPIAMKTPLSQRPLQPIGSLLFAAELSGNALTGWLSARDGPFDRREILVEIDGHIVTNIKACLHRKDQQGSEEDSFHGFSVSLPALRRRLRLIDRQTGTVFFKL